MRSTRFHCPPKASLALMAWLLVGCGTVGCGTVGCRTVGCGTVACRTVACRTVGCSTVGRSTVERSTVVGDDVLAGGHLAARCEHPRYDPANTSATCKVYHDVFAPDGRLLTKGIGGEFEHHRGLFFGFHQVRCGDRKFDFWHCHAGESQRFSGYVAAAELGLDDGWQVVAIDWCDAQGGVIVHERRALRARALDQDTTAIDVVCELAAGGLPVDLGGDPQHSGHQFRALDAFAPKDAPKVHYVRPATAKDLGDDVWTDCAWIGAILPLTDGPVTVLRTEAGGNPTAIRWSTRPYGRFGATFAHRLEPATPLRVGYTYAIALGTLDGAACAALAQRSR